MEEMIVVDLLHVTVSQASQSFSPPSLKPNATRYLFHALNLMFLH